MNYINYDFEYKGYKETWTYEIPADVICDMIRAYFDKQLITIDGTDTSIFNAFSGLDVIDEIFDEMEDWLKEQCEEKAYEEFKDWVDWYYDEPGEESLD